ncbi:MAG: tRNA pseudouridine(55) synthase TruB [Oxalobacteraceae bacterium]|nr:tRNA pseudouridine(55) synthase TruB [Oxalobacteraceae bacterium]
MTQPVKRKRVPVHGVLLLDKPVGMSSAQALAKAKWLLNAQKAGHTGTLDPFATGLLPLCFGEATKFAQDLLDADKTYETVVHLGITTETGDTEGTILTQQIVDVTVAQIESVLDQFRGPISQVPPMHSALKRDGKPLYEYARAGITLEREARDVTIHQLDLLAYDAPILRLRVACSKGTYIRVLGEDIGAALGCGAHLSALRRTVIGALDVSSALTLDQLAEHPAADRNSCLQPVDSLLSSFPALVLDVALASRFRQGQRIALDRAGVVPPCESGRVRVYQAPHCLLGTAQLSDGTVLAPERLLADIASH